MPEEILETPQSTETKSFDWPRIILAAVLGLGLLAAAAYAGYWYGTESARFKTQSEKPQLKTQTPPTTTPTPTPTPEPTASPTPSVEDETKDWKTYSNKQVGFTFKYPSTWTLLEENVPGTIFHLSVSETVTVPYLIINVRDDIDMGSYIKSRKITGMRQEFTSVGARDASLLTEETVTGGEIIWLVNNYKGELVEIVGTYNSSNKNAVGGIYKNLVSTFKFLD